MPQYPCAGSTRLSTGSPAAKPRMAPERVAGRQWLVAEHVEHRARQLPGIERRDQVGLDEMPAAPGIDETRAPWQSREQAGVEDALGRAGQRQQADQDLA